MENLHEMEPSRYRDRLDNLFDIRIRRALNTIRTATRFDQATDAYESAYDIASEDDKLDLRAALFVARARCRS